MAFPPERIVFNRVEFIDLMKLEGDTVLHLVDKDTLLSVAVLLEEGEKTNDVWDAYVQFWANAHVGYSDEIHDNQGLQFQSAEWIALLKSAGIKKTDSGVESHNALRAGERYNSYLRQIFGKVRVQHPQIGGTGSFFSCLCYEQYSWSQLSFTHLVSVWNCP